MLKFFNRVRVFTGTEGPGTLALGSAVDPSWLTAIEAGAQDGDETFYVLIEGDDFELGRGTIGNSVAEITRDTVLRSKIGGTAGTSKIDLTGSGSVFFTESAEELNAILAALGDIADALDDVADHIADTNNPHSVTASQVATSQTIAGANDVDGALLEILADPWWLQPIGKWIPLERDDHLPPNDKAYKYIIARAGLTGSEEYNEGKLDTESVTGSFPLVVATARIIVEGSPKFHHTISLIDTEGRSLRGSTSPGTVQNDQMQQITGSFSPGSGLRIANAADGAMSRTGPSSARADGVTGGAEPRNISFNSADSPNARAGSETRGKNIGVIHVMRVL